VEPSDSSAGKLVVKVFSTSDESVLASARNEAEILKKLNHPLVVKFQDYFEDTANRKAYIVMEKAGSQSLQEFIQKSKLCVKDAKAVT
jgi:serine/threonine protein kinase